MGTANAPQKGTKRHANVLEGSSAKAATGTALAVARPKGRLLAVATALANSRVKKQSANASQASRAPAANTSAQAEQQTIRALAKANACWSEARKASAPSVHVTRDSVVASASSRVHSASLGRRPASCHVSAKATAFQTRAR